MSINKLLNFTLRSSRSKRLCKHSSLAESVYLSEDIDACMLLGLTILELIYQTMSHLANIVDNVTCR